MRVWSRSELSEVAERIAIGDYCTKPVDIIGKLIDRVLPHDQISLVEFSEKYRKFKKGDGTLTPWSKKERAALLPLMNAHDNPNIVEIVAPKPSRIGGTVVGENYVLKMMHYGPTGRALWYHPDPDAYAAKEFKDIWDPEVHPESTARLGKTASDNKLTFKRFGSQYVELLTINQQNTASREGEYVLMDEVDSYKNGWQFRFAEAARQRQAQIGSRAKRYFCSHPDQGWNGGIAQAWLETSQGILVAPCPECDMWASAYPTKHWPEVPRYRLEYAKMEKGSPIAARIAKAEATASILCPNCGSFLDEKQRAIMADTCIDMHKGQILDVKVGPVGEIVQNPKFGLWLHILFSTQVPLRELAGRLEAAIEHYERTGKAFKIRDAMNRAMGEVFEGAGDLEGLDARSLKERTKTLATDNNEQTPVDYRLGEVPDGVRFITVAIDVGGRKFDILTRGWDNERRSWIIDRRTIRQRKHADGIMRDISPGKVQDDWQLLTEEIDRLYPMQSDPTKAMPVACMTIDASDGNMTWMAYEFARRMDGKRWGAWQRVRCIKGSTTATAPQLSPTPAKISKDSEGRMVNPVVTLHMLGVSKLKADALEDLAISDATPGQIYFPTNFMDRHFEELFNEVEIEGKWVRNGDNETLDLLGYTEAARLMLEPDRKDRDWTSGKEPVWARPVSLTTMEEGGDLAVVGEVQAVKPKTDYAAMISGMDRG